MSSWDEFISSAKKAFSKVKNNNNSKLNKIEFPAGSASIKNTPPEINYFQEKYIMRLSF